MQFENCKLSRTKLKQILESLTQSQISNLKLLRLINLDSKIFESAKVFKLMSQLSASSLEIRGIELQQAPEVSPYVNNLVLESCGINDFRAFANLTTLRLANN